MISNTTSYKLKALKSSKDCLNFDNQNEDNFESDSVDGTFLNERRQTVYTSRDGRYKGARPRQAEFRHTRVGAAERRGYGRGRGGSRRDADSYSKKYNDSLNSRDPGSMYFRSKCYEPEKKTEVKFNLPEDTRISKLLRRLSMENDQENSLTISKKLLEVLLIPDNASYVRKAFHILGESMLDILHGAPGLPAKEEAARALGRMGYIMGQENDFPRFQDWIFHKMLNVKDDTKYLFMKSLKETLRFDVGKPVLRDHAEGLMQDLVSMIEVLENGGLFKVTLDVLITLVEIYPVQFYSQFRDAMDILLGWHVDLAQPLTTIEFISKSLQRIRHHFQTNVEFSSSLVYNFFEDIEVYAKDLDDGAKDGESNSLDYLTVSILALNTVLKCLGDDLKPATNEIVNVKFITDCMIQIIVTLSNALKTCCPDNLIIATNENISLLLTVLGTKSSSLYNTIFGLVDLELSMVDRFSNATVISMLFMTSKVIKELSVNLPIELVYNLVGPDSTVIKLRSSHFVEVQEATICMYQALLNLKNIPLLQEAYRCVLGDLEVMYRQIVPNISPLCQSNPFTEPVTKDPELSVLFLLRCLSQLANSSSSIIGLWALKPSMLDLFAILLMPYSSELGQKAPTLQYSLLYLLYSHCKSYNHFIASSSLVSNTQALLGLTGDVAGKSPNSGNFALILDVLHKTLGSVINFEITLLVLQWLGDVLMHSEPYLLILYNSPEFSKVAKILVKSGYSYNNSVVQAVCNNLQKLLNKKELSWNNLFLKSVSDLCILHMNSTSKPIRDMYTTLSENLPWDLTLTHFNKPYSVEQAKLKCTDLARYSNNTVILAQHLHLSGAVYGEMLPFHFTTFMRYLLNGEERPGNLLEDVFTCCWPIETEPNASNANMEFFRSLALNSRAVLNNWVTFEAAQLCVNSKLRTPLGKPNETFTSFEVVLKRLAREVMRSKIDGEEPSESGKVDQKRVRMLLQFMEHLEKAIYNAAEGCAIAMPPAPKPVRTFFYTNASTCKEWLSRIRVVIVIVALHAGQSTVALRHGHALLANLVAGNKTNTVDFERAVMYVTLALLNLRENEAIYGLYTWCKKIADRKLEWVKFASDQANKKYESAVKNYKTLIERNKDEKDTDTQVQYFMSSQIVNCYKELNSWSEINEWKNYETSLGHGDNGLKHFFTTVNYDCINTLSNGDTIRCANKLNQWNIEETNSWSTYEILRNTESDLYNVASNINAPKCAYLLAKTDTSLATIQEIMQDNLLSLPSEFLQTFLLMHYVANGLKTILNNSLASNVFLVSENFENDIEKIDSTILTKILWWSEYFSRDQQNPGFNTFCSSLRLHIIRRARKEKNYELACLHLNRFMAQEGMFALNERLPLEDIGLLLLQKTAEFSTCTFDFAKSMKEAIKLLYATEENKQLVFNLCANASTAISKNADRLGRHDMKQISSKILLRLATWLQGTESNLFTVTDMTSPLVKLLLVLPEIGINVGTNIIPTNEMAIGKLLQFSVQQCITMGKNWFAFGTWCYRWGRKIIDHNSDITNLLTEEDNMAVRRCLPVDVSEDDFARILSILSQRPTTNEDDIDLNETSTVEAIREQLLSVPVFYNVHEQQLQSLIQIWKNSQKRIYGYYEMSVDSYFKYLHLAVNAENINRNNECSTITATLRLLRLIVKHALVLQNVIENGLANTPTHPWKVIIPQLFSRLNHPEAYVRERVSEFLCRVAEDAPHLITFPAVVGAVEGGVKFDFSEISMPKDCFSQSNENNEDNELNEIEDAYDSDTEETKNVLQSCFKSMVETLSKQAPETITQVQMLVKELRRITLLWDELWLGTLVQYNSEIIQRQHQLEVEIEKVNDNAHLDKDEKISLITEKYRIIMKPIIFILEQLQLVTSVEPETPHEKQFQERYAPIIKQVLEKLKNPDHPEKPQESWQPLKMLQSKFQQKAHKRTAYSLKMQDISPLLAGLKDTVIAMPGLTTSIRTQVTISNVSNHVSILPTKTKPKKLVFYGSDGQTYTYLFKGLEDLHLDERIMQFLSIANTMMAQGSDESSHNLYRARHYSVIPLGPRSGLISWVDGTTPVFALYKRWQQREGAKSNIKVGQSQRSNSNPNVGVLRPSELFYNKLNPLLQEHGVKNPESRKEWPLAILKQVLTELMAETPNDLLAKELWCHAVSAGEWWQMIRNYSYSVAVMSTLGYIIGLGDRHLDNVLVDLTSGEVVHIDYNVCFEKGKTLRVPEKVPFRLTPNIVEALGVTGVEGIFRLACENVLKTMKKGRETLLTLLEAFVYDPLVDWTVGGEGLAGTAFRGVAGNSLTRQSRKDLEREVTLSMYRVRCTEIKIDWNDNKTEILDDIPQVEEKLALWLEEQKNLSATEDLLQDLHQQMALVKEAEANGLNKHSFYSLPSRYESYRKRQDAISEAQADLELFINNANLLIDAYNEAKIVLEGHNYSQWIVELNISIEQESCHIFDLVKKFLQNAGKSSLVEQCEQSEADLEQVKHQQTVITTKCLHLLQEYSIVLSSCPVSYQEGHPILCFTTWSKYLLEGKNKNACDDVYRQFLIFNETNKGAHFIKAAVECAYHLNLQCNDIATIVAKVYDDFSSAKESNKLVEKIHANAKLALSTFIRCENDGVRSLKYIILNELCKQNKDFLNLETTVSRNGNVILKLQSQKGGDWFLDDLIWHSNNTLESIGYLIIQNNSYIEDSLLVQAVNGVQAVNNVYKSLQELYFSFHTIILPESMKKIMSEEASVMLMVGEIESLIHSVGMPLNELVAQLEKHLTCIVMEMEINPSYNFALEKMRELRTRYLPLVHNHSEHLTQGKMLLMGFNGLFDKVNLECQNCINNLSLLEIPPCWRKIDQVQQARSLAPPIFNSKFKAVLDDIFLLKRLQTMHDFFKTCLEMCTSFKVPTMYVIHNDEHLDKPIKRFISDFVTRHLLGISTETVAYITCTLLQSLGLNLSSEIEQRDIGAEHKVSLDELTKKAGNLFVKEGIFSQNVLAQASSLQSNLKSSWNVIQEIKQKEQRLALLQSSLVRLQGQATAYAWMYEHCFAQSGVSMNPSVTRAKFIQDLRAETANLKGALLRMDEINEQQKSLVSSVTSRLNWAAGVNPDVTKVLEAFEDAVAKRDERLQVEHEIARVVYQTGNSVFKYEALRCELPEAIKFEEKFVENFSKWQNACHIFTLDIAEVTSTEENIMTLYSPQMKTNLNWVADISEKLSEVITSTQKKLSERKENLFVCSDKVHTSLEKLRSSFSRHNKLMLEVKSLIKSMAKIEQCSANVQDFTVNYRQYTEHILPILHCFKKEINLDEVSEILNKLEYLKENTEPMYDSMVNLEYEETRGGRPLLVRQEGISLSPSRIMPAKQDSVAKGQQRNAYAMGVWRRVRLKLEGRDPDPGRKYTNQEQVDYIIREASSLDNLALMYEGWTPWV
ncbi:hypothetical protein PPYR_10179 [Photinus pyralis]|uniref:non-specific serine/threonine protein kinase n=2 Tax=Photinus pyralis TaxID=7054 RepID=A0A5N4AFW0_PHOPY|nr:serine/threonine-protein kinase SMG1 [Photinus pyralis]KAB0796118.1 hypothetical protein PPYR_10179 [Photinus pyralis]